MPAPVPESISEPAITVPLEKDAVLVDNGFTPAREARVLLPPLLDPKPFVEGCTPFWGPP